MKSWSSWESSPSVNRSPARSTSDRRNSCRAAMDMRGNRSQSGSSTWVRSMVRSNTFGTLRPPVPTCLPRTMSVPLRSAIAVIRSSASGPSRSSASRKNTNVPDASSSPRLRGAPAPPEFGWWTTVSRSWARASPSSSSPPPSVEPSSTAMTSTCSAGRVWARTDSRAPPTVSRQSKTGTITLTKGCAMGPLPSESGCGHHSRPGPGPP
ncbi:hypothetical protein LUX39_25255 [Actinomadura madurae]|nr:hypothetical protein [Actinomadura madurae]MCQ0016647.1 hypothetical protein [Actinomadura madurae]